MRTTGEVQTLVQSFNQMAEDVRDSTSARDASLESLVASAANADEVASRIETQRIQILGMTELSYLRQLSPPDCRRAVRRFFEAR